MLDKMLQVGWSSPGRTYLWGDGIISTWGPYRSVTWSPSTGAHAIYGDIHFRWVLVRRDSSLGFPISDEQDFSEGGRVSVFQRGAIYWWPDVGAIDLNDVVLHYTGLICFNETDGEVSASDEPYSVIGIISPNGTSNYGTQIYENVDTGESVPDLVELYRGKPLGLTISVLVMEHDSGDPNKYRGIIKDAVDKGFDKVKTALPLIPAVGPILAVVGPPILDLIAPEITEFINTVLGTGDDKIGETTIYLSPKQMVVMAALTNNSSERGIGYKTTTPLLQGDGSMYKLYFGLVPG
ncbi:MAG: LGFP repeat-containing protein [Planctomycetaceae bacterium]